MNLWRKNQSAGKIIQAFRIAVGSGTAMYAASLLHLDFSSSAGMITLLTILTTKWDTLKLSAARILTFFMGVLLAGIIFTNVQSAGAAFGIYVFFLFVFSEWIGWRITASVNAVIGTHFLANRDFTFPSVLNEFLILIIGISIAVLVNMFRNNEGQKNKIIDGMRQTETTFAAMLEEMASYLTNSSFGETGRGSAGENVWKNLSDLKESLEQLKEQAYIYQNNTFQSHTSYYSSYFEMRTKQCQSLQNLQSEMEKLKELPSQAEIIAKYMLYLRSYVKEMNRPKMQMNRLIEIAEELSSRELPKTQTEFEGRVVLYHIVMDLEDFIRYKQQFVDKIDDTQFCIYWKKEVGDFELESRQ